MTLHATNEIVENFTLSKISRYTVSAMLCTEVTAASVSATFAPLSLLQKDTGSAMAKHSGAHLDLSAFSSAEVRTSIYV